MSICAACGLQLPGDAGLCRHHPAIYSDADWATANRIICNGLHRGTWAPRLSEAARADVVDETVCG